MVSQSKPTPPIVSCGLVHAVSLLNTKVLSSIYSKFITLDYSRKQQQQQHRSTNLGNYHGLIHPIYSIRLIQAYTASKPLDEPTVYLIL